jgi:hypothetical protein
MAKFLFSASLSCCGGEDVVLYIPDDILEEMITKDCVDDFMYEAANDLFSICSDCVEWKQVEDNYGYNGLVSREGIINGKYNYSYYRGKNKYYYVEGEGV